MRGTAGFPDPFNVKFWGVGNESWGCGGNFTPEEYASEFRRYTDSVRSNAPMSSLVFNTFPAAKWKLLNRNS